MVRSAESRPASLRKSRKAERDLAGAGRGLEQHGVARDERMQRMNRGQKERIISRPDHEHKAEWLALDFKRNAVAARADARACRSDAARARALRFRSSQRQASASGRTSETSFSASGRSLTAAAAMARASAFSAIRWRSSSDNSQALRDRFLRPTRLRVARFRAGRAHSFSARIKHGVHHAGSRFMGASCGAAAAFAGGASPRSASSRRELMRADSKITGSPLPGCVPPPTR